MKTITQRIFLIVALITSMHYSALAQGFGKKTKLTAWHFHLGDVRGGQYPIDDNAGWENVVVPHDWSVHLPANDSLYSCTGYLPSGVGWYQKEVTIPNDTLLRFLYFGGIYKNSEVYVNGNWVGYRPNGYVSFQYDISKFLKPGKNLIAVKVDHSDGADSRWYTGSGIYRDCYLVESNPLHLELWGVSYQSNYLGNKEWSVSTTTSLVNQGNTNSKVTVIQELVDQDGVVVGSSKASLNLEAQSTHTMELKLEVAKAESWNLESPYLYQLDTRVTDGKRKLIDESRTAVGLRTIRFNAETGFYLNDKNLKAKGVCLHHDAGVLGAAVPKEVWRQRLKMLKSLGVNAIRMSHNPQASDLYDLCDEMGFLVMDEAFDEWEYPKKKWIEGWNKGEPGFEGYAQFFKEWGKRDLADMVKRNRNHPSIIMWSIGNEVDFPNDPYSHPILNSSGIDQIHSAGYNPEQPDANRLGDIAYELAQVVRKYDRSRPVTAALAGAVMSNQTDYPGVLDVVGYNYTEDRYESDHEKYPSRILYGSETRHNIEAWLSVTNNDFIFGQFLWTGVDYLGEAGAWPSRGSGSGLLDLSSNIKPRGYYREALWSDEPAIYLGSYKLNPRWADQPSIDAPKNWDYKPGDTIRVMAYSNCTNLKLRLNDKLIGKEINSNTQLGMAYWDIVYEPGVLRVEGKGEDGQIWADEIRTPGVAKIISVNVVKNASDNGVFIVNLELKDGNGYLAYSTDKMVVCEVSGNGELIGLENASKDASLNYLGNQLTTNSGKLTAYVRTTSEDGEIHVKFSSEGMEPLVKVIRSN
ncbi:MAG: glycoside hydrolase family 2 TIM barrel-domain containing protein [Marinoscillum sp.]